MIACSYWSCQQLNEIYFRPRMSKIEDLWRQSIGRAWLLTTIEVINNKMALILDQAWVKMKICGIRAFESLIACSYWSHQQQNGINSRPRMSKNEDLWHQRISRARLLAPIEGTNNKMALILDQEWVKMKICGITALLELDCFQLLKSSTTKLH